MAVVVVVVVVVVVAVLIICFSPSAHRPTLCVLPLFRVCGAGAGRTHSVTARKQRSEGGAASSGLHSPQMPGSGGVGWYDWQRVQSLCVCARVCACACGCVCVCARARVWGEVGRVECKVRDASEGEGGLRRAPRPGLNTPQMPQSGRRDTMS